MVSNDSPGIPDRGETSDIPGLPSGAQFIPNTTDIHSNIKQQQHLRYEKRKRELYTQGQTVIKLVGDLSPVNHKG